MLNSAIISQRMRKDCVGLKLNFVAENTGVA